MNENAKNRILYAVIVFNVAFAVYKIGLDGGYLMSFLIAAVVAAVVYGVASILG